jgi:hypothetical protein
LYSLLLSRNMKVKVYKNLNSASFIWLWNLIQHITGRAQTHGAVENIWN